MKRVSQKEGSSYQLMEDDPEFREEDSTITSAKQGVLIFCTYGLVVIIYLLR
jgi:hypothetical protein